MATYKTPGVYVEEISTLPPSVAEVETAIPVFFGYTEKGEKTKPVRITSLVEYQIAFGNADPEKSLSVNVQGETVTVSVDPKKRSKNVLFYAMQLYFANGGGPCYIIPVGNYEDAGSASLEAYQTALDAAAKEDEPTLLVMPDAPYIIPGQYYDLVSRALQQCNKLGDRFVIIDVLDEASNLQTAKQSFRDKLGVTTEIAKYGAAYYPYLNTSINYYYNQENLSIAGAEPKAPEPEPVKPGPVEDGKTELVKPKKQNTGAGGFGTLHNALQNRIKQKIQELGVELTPAAAIAGVYAQVDSSRGVWKAPANVPLTYVKAPALRISDEEQMDLNVDAVAGKSINAVRAFAGRGTRIWGARTLAGNDNEWRYINIRRFFNMVEESVKKSTGWAVFEPNDINTWTKVRAMIENYLLLKWKDGALAGAKPDDAFFVRVGLGQTMSAVDVLEGRMNVEIGLAAVRPAEFIILKFSHKIQNL